jgi:hypothetical protein
MNEVGAPIAFQPEMWIVRKDYIYAAIYAVENGLDYAKMCLQEHDLALGRTTLKNRTWAETMERDIAQIEQTLGWLKSLTGETKKE